MAKQVINIGAAPNDGTGTPLRTSFDYTNQNFTELYNGSGIGTSTNTQVLFNDSGVANGDAGLVYNKTTDALSVGGALGVTGITTLTGAATVQGLTVGKGASAISTNTAFGTSALAAVTAASDSTAFGYRALSALQTGTRSTAFGGESLFKCVSGGSNTAVGQGSLYSVVSGTENSAVGDIALSSATGSYNTGMGRSSLQILVAGNQNTAIGKSAGDIQTAGSNNGFFGYNAQADSPTGSNQYTYGDANVTSHKFRNGDVVVGNGNVVMSTSGKGIDFSATASGSGTMTSELLADYEEGTWVPTDASGAGLAITSSACRYTKIGRAVTIQGTITYPTTANTTASRIAGIPFAFSDIAPMSISYIGSGGSTVFYFMGFGANELEFYGNAGSGIQNATLSTLSIRFFGTYYI